MRIGTGIGTVLSGGVHALTHQDDFDWGDFAAATRPAGRARPGRGRQPQ
ncbi:hypothetical protein OG548_07225 [Streptomyces sp. NBC_01356]|nr:hypothetical protein [Streptomyces sp. NBC_01356]